MVLSILSDIADLVYPFGEANASGISQLRLVPADGLILLKPHSFLAYGTGTDVMLTPQNLFFANAAGLTDVTVLPDYSSFTDDMEVTPNGTLFKPAIQLAIPKLRPEVTAWIAKYNGVRWVAFLQDRNGFYRCVGTPEQPLSISVSQSAGSGLTGRNMTLLTFSGQVEQPAFFLTGIADADLILSTEFDASFGIEFNS